MPRVASVPPLTANQARYSLEKLIDDGTVSAADVRRHLAGMWQEMSFIEKRLSELRGIARPVKHPSNTVRAVVKRARRRRRRIASPEVAPSQRIQGQRPRHMRHIPAG